MAALRDAVIADAPLSLWPLDDAAGATAAADAMGFQNATTVGSGVTFGQPSFIPGEPGATCANFDGTANSHVRAPDLAAWDFAASDAMTLECWIKLDTSPAFYAFMGSRKGFDGGQYWMEAEAGSGNLSARILDTAAVESRIQPITHPSGQVVVGGVYHVVFTYSGANDRIILYKNGGEVGRLSPVGTMTPGNTNGIGMGDRHGGQSDIPMDGLGAFFAIYDKELSSRVVRQHYILGALAPGDTPGKLRLQRRRLRSGAYVCAGRGE